MKKLKNTNHNPPDGYELFKNVKDTLGRSWKLMASPTKAGSIAYFVTLSDYIHWVRQVEEIRDFANGRMGIHEKIFQAMLTGDISETVAIKLIE